MYIILVASDYGCHDDGIKWVIIADTAKQAFDFLMKQPYSYHPTQMFEIGISAQGVVGEMRECNDSEFPDY